MQAKLQSCNNYQIVHGTKGHMAVYGPGCHPQNIIWSINCHLSQSAMNYLLYYTQYMQIYQTTCFVIVYLRQKTSSDKIQKKTLY
jgi:hypothetical protein